MSPGRVRLTAFILREPVLGRALRSVRVGRLSIDLAVQCGFIAALIRHSIAFNL